MNYVGLADGFCKACKAGGSYMLYNYDKNNDIQLEDLLSLSNPIIRRHRYLHPKNIRTNNSAELLTIYDLLAQMSSDYLNPDNKVLLLSDSEVSLKLITQVYKCHSAGLKLILNKIWNIGKRFKNNYNLPISTCLNFKHIPGDWQKLGPIGH